MIAFVCSANYCRSPVAEKIFKSINDDIEVVSFGLAPVVKSSMDIRSQKFLDSINICDNKHQPKKLLKNDFISCKIIFALDVFISQTINQTFPENSHKILLINYFNKSLITPDPFNMNNEDYLKCMVNIEKNCKLINKNINDIYKK